MRKVGMSPNTPTWLASISTPVQHAKLPSLHRSDHRRCSVQTSDIYTI